MTDTRAPTIPAHEQAQQTTQQLRTRLDRVEGQMKVLVRFLIPGLSILAIAALFMQLNKPTVISAKSVFAEAFAVQNARGDIVVQMSADSDGSPHIAFRDANKKIRLIASVGASGPSVSLLDPQGISRAALSLNETFTPSLTMANADNLPRSVFAIDKGGSGHLILYGTAGGLDLAAHDGRVRWTPLTGAPVDALPVTK